MTATRDGPRTAPGGGEIGPIEQVVLQPTPFCNLDCKYCYLPNRADPSRMRPETATAAIAAVAKSAYAAGRIECRWHAGEPLAVPVSFYRSVFEALKEDAAIGERVWHSLQTNGTLLNEDWCDLFAEHAVAIGVSIDGPKELNDANRVARSGRGTFDEIVRGIERLRRRGIPFDAIAVLTRESVRHPRRLYDFFAELGARQVGFNIEESEGGHASASLAHPDFFGQYRQFLREMVSLQRDGRVRIRELREMERVVRFGGRERKSLMAHPLSIVSVDWRGNASSFSPELLGQDDLRYGHFLLGNVLEDSMEAIAARCLQSRMHADVRAGVDRCRRECAYYFLCGGGAPANKLYENGTFVSTETGYCKGRIKIVADLVIESLEKKA